MKKSKKSTPILVRPDYEFQKDNIEIRHKHFNDGTNLHWHDYYEMEIITKGSGYYYINGNKVPLKRGSAYLVTPVDFHTIDGDFELFNIAFNESMLSEAVMNIITSVNPATTVTFSESEFVFIEKTVSTILEEYENDAPMRSYAIKSLMDYVMIQYLRKLDTKDEDTGRSDVAVMRVASYIKFNFKNKLTLAQAAEAVHLTPNYIGEIFAKKMGMTFNAYLMQTRLNYAKNLLMRGDCTVEEVAYNSGFSSQTYFSDCFRKQFGYTPTSVKKKAYKYLIPDIQIDNPREAGEE